MGKYLYLNLLFVLLFCAVGTTRTQSISQGDLNYKTNADNATVTEPYVSLDGHNGRGSFCCSYYIKDVMVIGGNQSEVNALKAQYQAEGWTLVNKDLNAGCGSGSDYIYLLYKTEPSEGVNTGFITAFYISDNGDPIEDSLTYNLRTYHLVPYDGGSHFVNRKGDLNSNAGGASIHLYYTRKPFYNNKTVTDITFNSTQSGAVPLEGSGSGYDLNTGCGSSTENIYMHVTTESSYTEFVFDDLIYGFNPDGTSVTVKGHNNPTDPTGELNFHDSVCFDYNGHYYTVTRIGYEAFRDCTGLTGNLTIPNSVTTIEGGAFRNCHGLTGDLTIPNSVTNIGGLAFRDCTGFTGNLTIPNSVTVIGPQAFRNCYGLTGDVTIPNSVTTIEAYTFCDCDGFNGSLTIPNSVTSIGNLAFYCCSNLSGSLTIPNSVTSIGDWAFAKCYNLTGDLTIPNSVTSIGDYAFYDCTSIDGSLTIPNSVTTIGVWTFANCKLSGNLTIPNSVTSIGEHAFTTCLYFTGILTIPNSVTTIGYRAFYQCIRLTGLTLGDSLTTIGEEAFYRCYDLTGSLTIPRSVTTIGAGAFRECTGFTEINSLAETPPTLGDDVFGGWDKTNTPVHVPYGSLEAYNGWGGFSNIMETFGYFITDVMLIGSDVHSEANSLRDYYVSQGWTFVDQDLNAGCGSGSYWIYLLYKAETSPGINLGYITDFYITNADNPVDDSFVAANGHTYYIAPCDGNEHFVEIKGDLNCGVGGSADIHLYYTKERFTNNRAVTNIWFNDTKAGGVGLNGDNSEGYDLNKGCGSGSDYIYMHISTAVADTEFTSDNLRYSINPDYTSVTVESHYYGSSAAGPLILPESVNYGGHNFVVNAIGASAFAGCSGLTGTLTIPNTVNTIGDEAFYGCYGFQGDLTIPNSVTTIGTMAFWDCHGFTGTLTIPNSVTTIGVSAFYGCYGFTGALTIPNSMSTIETSAFAGCSGFDSLTIPNSVTAIGYYAFYGCNGFMGDLTLPESLTTIVNSAFSGCSSFTGTLTIPNSLTTIGNDAFSGCTGFDFIFSHAETPPTLGSGVFYGWNTNTTTVFVPSGSVDDYSSIQWGGFTHFEASSCEVESLIYTLNDDLETVTLYGHVNGTNASGELHIVDSVLLNNRYCHVVAIRDHAFQNCNGLSGSLTLPQTLVTIGNNAFSGCTGLSGSLTIPNSVTSIGEFAFFTCIGFNGTLTLSDALTTIEYAAFYACIGLTGSLTLPDAVTTIGRKAFSSCTGFNGTLTLGSALNTIDNYAFESCINFTAITSCAATPPALGNYPPFYGWSSTIPVTVPCGSGTAYSSISWGGFSNFIEDCHNDIVAHAQYYPYPDNSDSPYTVAYWDIELTDDFETGDFSKSPWQMDALYPWVICDTVSHSGTYCMRSGNIGQNSTASTMTVTMNIPKDGMISFYAKISCEDPWDKGYFYIDDVQKGSWTGEIDYWMECQYPITAGQHTFLWKYEKDISGENGDDCFYIDDIVFYRIAPPTVPCDPSAVPSTDLFDVYRAKADGTDLTLLAEDYNSHYYVDSTWVNLPHESNYKYGITYANDTLFVWSNLLHTKLDIPQNLVTPDDKVFNDEQITISWAAITATALQKYNVYRDGYKIGETTTNTYTDGPLAYNMQGYVYYVTAVYDEMDESAPSNTVNVKVSGYGNVNGHAFEQDGVTGIAGAIVTLTGNDEFGGSHTFDFTTDNNGYYSGQIYAGSYNGQASHDDYLTTNEPVQGNPVVIHYNQTTSPIDLIMEDLWIENGVNITVFLNSADSPEGVHVVLTQDSIQASLNPMGDDELEIILDETGYYVWEQFRKGTYYVEISMEAYETIHDTVPIMSSTGMMYVMTEILYSPKDVYVSRTGWASWQPGDRHFEAYKVVLTDLDDHSLYTENVSTNALQLPTDSLVDNTLYKLKVANLYSTGQSEYVECNWLYTSCDHFEGFSEITGTVSPEGVNLNWTYPDSSVGEPMAVSLFIDGEWQGFVNGNSYYDAQGTIDSQYEARVVYDGDTLCPNNNIDMSMSCLQAVPLQYLEYTVTATANPTAGGTITGAGTYDHGTTVNLTATANTGYTFTNWTQGGTVVSTDATYSFVVTQDTTFVANFSLNTYEVTATANPTAGGTITGAGTYDHGATVNLTATANTGYTFTNWTQGGTVVSTDATYSFVVTQDTTFVANFSLNSYEITVTTDPIAGGTVSGPGTYNHGESCTLTATANEGYTFVNWTKGSTIVSTNAIYTFTVTEAASYVAHFELNSYEITATANPTEGGTVSGAGTYDHGESCTMIASASEGYAFVNWTEGGSPVSTSPTYTFEVTSERTLVANFTASTYVIAASVVPEGSGTVTGAGGYEYGQSCTLTATANAGHAFINWTEGGSEVSTESAYTFTVTSSRTLVANFSTNSYDITATANPAEGGTITGAGTYNHGQSCTLTATANEGYTFLNWTNGSTEVSTDATYIFTVTEDASYVAHFDLNSYEITATANPSAGGTVTGEGTYNHGESCMLTATSNEGYTFVNWTKGGTVVSTDATYIFTVTEAASYVAHFELNSYVITATTDPIAGGTVSGPGTYNHGESCTLTATANEGYTFVNWTKGSTIVSTNATYTFTVTENASYVAHFELNSFEITATADPTTGGTISGAGTYNFGESCTLTATANEGYTFVNWTEGGSPVSADATYTFTVSGTRALVANFSASAYVIAASVVPEGSGTVTGAGGYEYGQSCTLTATANAGHAFINWTESGSEVSTEPTYTFIVTNSRTLVANFSTNSYDITATANPAEGGTVTGAGTYNHGQSCTLTATANAGHAFINWTESGSEVSTEPTYTFTVTNSRTLVANFSTNSYDITATANPAEGGTISGAGTYNHGQSCTLTATANEGYTFVNWTKGSTVVSTNATYTFTVTETASYVAHFMDAGAGVTQTTNFVSGCNWWSGYIELNSNSLMELQDGLGTNGINIKSQNSGYNSYYEGLGWYGMLSSINNESTYQIRTTGPCTVTLTGTEIDPASHPITLTQGWSWIGYPVNVSQSLADAFAGITAQMGDMIKSQNDGYASYLEGFGWYGAFNTLTPGMGLMYKSTSSGSITLVYPNGGSKGEMRPNQKADNNHWKPNLNAYMDNMSVMAVIELDDEELRGTNYELAAFANGECRGSARLLYVAPLDRYMAFLTVAGEEAAELHFGLYNTETGAVETQCAASLQYETDAVWGSFAEPYVVSFRSATGVDEWARSLNVFPNPVDQGQTVSLGFSVVETGEVQVEIINALGTVMETCRGAYLQEVTAPNTAGVYTLRITVEGKGTCYRKLVVR